MITGVHAIVFSKDAEGVRELFQATLGFPSVDAGDGWLIFALPPAELAVHPSEGADHHELYLMCDDLNATVEELKAKGVELAHPVREEAFGLLTAIVLPGGGELGLYERDTRVHSRRPGSASGAPPRPGPTMIALLRGWGTASRAGACTR